MAVKKKAIDTWKTKIWYSLMAPKLFNEVEVAQIPAQDDEHLLNRVIVFPLKDITKDISHLYTNVKLRVENIVGKKAFAKFIGHSVAREHLHALGRRNRSLLYVVFPTKSADGVEFTVKVLIVTSGKASGNQRAALRKAVIEKLAARVAKEDFGPFIQATLYGKAGSELHGALKKLFPVRSVEIYKTELKEVFDVETVESEEEPQAKTVTQAEDEEETEEESEEETETLPETKAENETEEANPA